MLINNLFERNFKNNINVDNLTFNSKKANNTSVFFSIIGYNNDGHNFVMDAYENGCRVFVVSKEVNLPNDCQIVMTDDTSIYMAKIASRFYDYPEKNLHIIGITGTKGKTSVSYFIKEIFEKSNISVAVIGTTGILYDNKKIEINNTTPDTITLHKYFRIFADTGIQFIVMEVSSQAYKNHRVEGIDFDLSVFLNLSPDHISPSEHKDFNEYKKCKSQLFSNSKMSIMNLDDEWYDDIKLCAKSNPITFSCKSKCDFYADNIHQCIENSKPKTSFDVYYNINKEKIHINMCSFGMFNVYNALAAISVCKFFDVPTNCIVEGISNVNIPGRLQIFRLKNDAMAIIDYAHNGVSLENLLVELKKIIHDDGKLILVFGSVGNKSEIRRKELALISEKYSDYVIVTTDNPNYEPPSKIIDDIVSNFSDAFTSYTKIEDRKKAILHAVYISNKNDIIVLAGKGHEKYQLVNGIKEYFSEVEILEKFIG